MVDALISSGYILRADSGACRPHYASVVMCASDPALAGEKSRRYVAVRKTCCRG